MKQWNKLYSGTQINNRVTSATFLNNEQLLIRRSCQVGAGDQFNADCYSLYVLDVTTGKRELILAAKQTSRGQGARIPQLFDVMPQYPNKVLVTINRMPQFTYRYRDLYWLDLETKETTKIAEVPTIDNEQFFIGWLIMKVTQEDSQLVMMLEEIENQIC